MQLDIRGLNIAVTDAIRTHIEEKYAPFFERFGSQLQRATVRIEDTNGPRGGADKTCKLHVHLLPTEDLIIEETDADLYVAIDKVAHRCKEKLARRADKLPSSHARSSPHEPHSTADIPGNKREPRGRSV